MLKIIKILDSMINGLIIILIIWFILLISVEIYENIEITNKIKNPEECLKINNDYYCKIEKVED